MDADLDLLFPTLSSQSGFHKRRAGLRDTIEWLARNHHLRRPSRALSTYTA